MEKKITTGKRLLAVLLVVLMLLTNLPARAQAATYYYNERSYPTTIILTDNSGERVTGATITVTRSNDKHIVAEGVNGQYYFSRSGNQKNRIYTITVTASGYETATTTMRGDKSSVSISLEKKEDEFATFGVYYTADGGIPDNGYAGSNPAADYGPSADDTPLTQIRVNLTKLIEISKQENSPVVYGNSNLASGNQYEFTPAGSHTDSDFKEKIRLFWDAVISCTDSTSIEAFEETGLYDSFMMYCLKKQRSGSLHGDGILNVTPPVYVVELYQNEVYFGGGVTDTAANSIFLTAYDILDQYEAHLKQTITWVEDENGKPKLNEKEQFTGTYVDPATNKIHNIAVFQTNKAQAQAIEGSEIPYTKQTNTYYLSQFNMSVDAGTQIRYLVTYTDGVAEYDIFSEHEYAADRGDTVPAFTGVTNREEYVFLGWYLEGNTSGKIYSDKEIAEMTVSADMVFHAVWQVVPKYTGTVKVIINGKYDSTTQTLISGTLADIHVPLGVEESAGLYVSANGQEYIELTRDSQGVYSAVLENGEYYLYYSIDGGETFVQPSRQLLSIVNADRIRYLFYNTVYHDLSGGTLNGSSDNIYEYFYSGKAVTVCDKDPVREGYIFGGWKSNDGTVYTSGQIALDPATGELVGETVEEQAEQVMKNLMAVLEAAGTKPENVVKTLCFLTDINDFAAFNEVYAKYFTEKPARSCVGIKSLPKGAICEVEVIAVL